MLIIVMAVADDADIMSTLWTVITELSEQLNHNRSLAVSLYAQAGGIKNQAIHTQTGFVLRRFNLDKSKGGSARISKFLKILQRIMRLNWRE